MHYGSLRVLNYGEFETEREDEGTVWYSVLHYVVESDAGTSWPVPMRVDLLQTCSKEVQDRYVCCSGSNVLMSSLVDSVALKGLCSPCSQEWWSELAVLVGPDCTHIPPWPPGSVGSLPAVEIASVLLYQYCVR